MLHVWTVLAVAAAWVASTGFIVRYSLVRWDESPGGRAIMALSVSTWLIASSRLGALLGWLPHVSAVVLSVGWTGMALAMAWRWAQLSKAQAGKPSHAIGPPAADHA